MCARARGAAAPPCSKLLTTLHHAYFALLPRIYDIFTPVPATGCTGTPGAFTTHAVNRISPALLNEPASPWEQNHFGKLVSALLRARYSPPFYLINSCRGEISEAAPRATRSAIPRNNSLFPLSTFLSPPLQHHASRGVNRELSGSQKFITSFFFSSRVFSPFFFSLLLFVQIRLIRLVSRIDFDCVDKNLKRYILLCCA